MRLQKGSWTSRICTGWMANTEKDLHFNPSSKDVKTSEGVPLLA